MFSFSTNLLSIKDIYSKFRNGDLIIDSSYQRRSVWGEKDKVRLIETILLNLVIPELFFWQATIDPETGDSITHIVDGQQRINSIADFLNNKFKLQEKFLLEEDTKELYAGKLFSELDNNSRSQFWGYKLSIVEIDPNASKHDIKKMFRRLNLTDYNLNDQEKRNSLSSEFATLAKDIAADPFWENNNLFRNSDVRRMKDVEFCSSILLLWRKGIIEQSDQSALNTIYEDLAVNYCDADDDRKNVEKAIDVISLFINTETSSFVRRRTQLYSLFSIIFYTIRENIDINEEMIERFSLFAKAYMLFKNNEDLTLSLTDEEKIFYNELKKYKLASSEGLNKYSNRMLRYKILKYILFGKDINTIIMKSLSCKMSEFKSVEMKDDMDDLEDFS